jgi:hypothetical protein
VSTSKQHNPETHHTYISIVLGKAAKVCSLDSKQTTLHAKGISHNHIHSQGSKGHSYNFDTKSDSFLGLVLFQDEETQSTIAKG